MEHPPINEDAQPEPGERQPAAPSTTEDTPEQAEEQRREPARIYIASLADYNNGYYHGVWIDATLEPAAIREQIHAMLKKSPVLQREGEDFGDWAIHDYEGFGTLRLDELEDPEYLHSVASGIQEHGDAFAAWIEVQDSGNNDELDHMEQRFSEAFLGEHDSLSAFGETIADDMGWQSTIDETLPEGIARYTRVDSASLAHDMWLSGEVAVVHNPGGRVWIFRTDV